jgi:TP901 family phage tail tape measure protein
MSEQIDINLDETIFEQLKRLQAQFDQLNGKVDGFAQESKKGLEGLKGTLKTISFTQITQGFRDMTQGLNDLNAPGLKFESSMADMQAITGLSGKALSELGEKARENAKTFGGDAASSLESYKLLLSQLTPELAKTPVVLDKMASNVAYLSKTMGGDTVAATEVLTTAMNQYGVSMDDPKKALAEMTGMMNTMSAAAKEGSAELPIIKQAIENSGGAAKEAGLNFAQLNSAVQFLDKAGKKGAEGGTALRSILTTLSKGRFLPENTQKELIAAGVNVNMLADKNVSFTDKMRMLQPVLQKDASLINTLFGEYGQAASALIRSADAQDKMSKAITGTNTTREQANVIMETHEEKLKRVNAEIADAKIKFFEATGGATAYLEPISQLSMTFSSFMPLMSGASSAFSKLKMSMSGATAGVGGFAGGISGIKSMLPSLGTALKGVGLMAFIALAADAGMKLYNMASGADAAARAIERMQQARETGKKDAEFWTDKGTRATNIANKANERELKKGNISEEQYEKRKLEIARNSFAYFKASKENALAEAQILEENAKKFKAQGNDKAYRGALASRKQRLAEAYAISKATQDAQDVYLDLKAEKEGKGKIQTTTAPTVSAKGYSTPPAEKVYSGAGEVKHINIRIENLVKDLSISTTNLKESTADVQKLLTEALVQVVRNTETSL